MQSGHLGVPFFYKTCFSQCLAPAFHPGIMLALRNLQKAARSAWSLNSLMATGAASAVNVQPDRGATSSVYNVGAATNIKFHEGMVPRDTKEKLLGQKGVILWFTGG